MIAPEDISFNAACNWSHGAVLINNHAQISRSLKVLSWGGDSLSMFNACMVGLTWWKLWWAMCVLQYGVMSPSTSRICTSNPHLSTQYKGFRYSYVFMQYIHYSYWFYLFKEVGCNLGVLLVGWLVSREGLLQRACLSPDSWLALLQVGWIILDGWLAGETMY